MPINRTVEGNIIKIAKEGNHRYIVQGCNCFSIQGSGLAPQMCEAFEGLYEADKEYIVPEGEERLGRFSSVLSTCETGDDKVYGKVIQVCNMYTQYRGGFSPEGYPIVSYEGIFEGFKLLNERAVDQYTVGGVEPTVLIPKIGCGLAQGNWDMVRCLIDEATPDLDITYVEYLP